MKCQTRRNIEFAAICVTSLADAASFLVHATIHAASEVSIGPVILAPVHLERRPRVPPTLAEGALEMIAVLAIFLLSSLTGHFNSRLRVQTIEQTVKCA